MKKLLCICVLALAGTGCASTSSTTHLVNFYGDPVEPLEACGWIPMDKLSSDSMIERETAKTRLMNCDVLPVEQFNIWMPEYMETRAKRNAKGLSFAIQYSIDRRKQKLMDDAKKTQQEKQEATQ